MAAMMNGDANVIDEEKTTDTWYQVAQFVCWEYCRQTPKLVTHSKLANKTFPDLLSFLYDMIVQHSKAEEETEIDIFSMVAKFIEELCLVKSQETVHSPLNMGSVITRLFPELEPHVAELLNYVKEKQDRSEYPFIDDEDFCDHVTKFSNAVCHTYSPPQLMKVERPASRASSAMFTQESVADRLKREMTPSMAEEIFEIIDNENLFDGHDDVSDASSHHECSVSAEESGKSENENSSPSKSSTLERDLSVLSDEYHDCETGSNLADPGRHNDDDGIEGTMYESIPDRACDEVRELEDVREPEEVGVVEEVGEVGEVRVIGEIRECKIVLIDIMASGTIDPKIKFISSPRKRPNSQANTRSRNKKGKTVSKRVNKTSDEPSCSTAVYGFRRRMRRVESSKTKSLDSEEPDEDNSSDSEESDDQNSPPKTSRPRRGVSTAQRSTRSVRKFICGSCGMTFCDNASFDKHHCKPLTTDSDSSD